MNKVYGRTVLSNIVLIAVLIEGMLDIYIAFKQKDLFSIILLIVCFCGYLYIAVALSRLYFLIDDLGIKVDTSSMFPRRELHWEDIRRITDDSYFGIHIYHLIPKGFGKKVITIGTGVADRSDLLKEIVAHVSEQTIIDDSIKNLISAL